MAHYQNGYSRYYNQNTNSPAESAQQFPPGSYDLYATQQHPNQLRRVPSYNAGDDAGLIENSCAHNSWAADGNARYAVAGGGHGGYTVSGSGYDANRDPRYAQFRAGNASHVQRPAPSSYQYQTPTSVPTSTPTQPVYNPQQYARPQAPSQQPTGHNSLWYSGSRSSYSARAPINHSYNPAAYQSASVAGYRPANAQPHAGLAPSYSQNPPTSQPYGYPSQAPPPPPPRGPDHPYGSRPSFQYTKPPPDSVYGFAESQTSSPDPWAYSRQSRTTPVTAYVSSNTLTNANSTTFGYYPPGTQAPMYALQPPRRESDVTAHSGEQPPEPPVHSTRSDNPYGKSLSVSRPQSGRSLPTPPAQQNLPHLPPRRTDTLTRHPQSRPLPGPPVEAVPDSVPLVDANGINKLHDRPEGELSYEDLVKEVEAAVMDSQSATARRYSRASTEMRLSPDERHTHTNGNMATGTGPYVNYDAYSDDSDAEAAAGLAMLQVAEEEDRAREERLQGRPRRGTNASSIASGSGSHGPATAPSPHDDFYDEEDYVGEDLGSYGGGYEGHLLYGDELEYSQDDYSDEMADRDRLAPTSGSFRSSNVSSDSRGNHSDDYDYLPVSHGSMHRSSQVPSHARVDAGGTGGLAAPDSVGRRMSFDYGDEQDGTLQQPHDSNRSGSEVSEMGESDDLFFHPGMKPLPPAPVEPADNANLMTHLVPAGTYRQHEHDDLQDTAQYTLPSFPDSADIYGPTIPSPSQVPRSTSLSTHPISPRMDPPIRSKTDADRDKYKQQQEFLRRQQYGTLKLDTSQQENDMLLDLPTLPAGRRKKFNPEKLSSEHFKKCREPWALSAILTWVKDLSHDEADLKEQVVVDAIVALFTHKVPTMNIADAETLAGRVVEGMLVEGALVRDEEWVKFSAGALSGVLFQITGMGCYSPRLHEQETEVLGRCYSHHCMRTLKKVNLKAELMEPQKKVADWVTFYNVPKEVWESHPKKEVDRQNNLHEIVTTEDLYISQLDVLRELYRDHLAKAEPPVIAPKRLDKFLADVFGKVEHVKRANEDHLLAQLKYRQKEQGPFIVGFSDIFREWIRKAKAVYIDYAATFPNANYLVRKEAERNSRFREFLSQARDHKLSNRLSWDTFLKSPLTRIQRYTLLLSTVHKNMLKDSEEKTNLAQAIEEIKVVALECDNKVGEASRKVDLMELSSKLQLRPEMKREVELNLEHLGREIVFRGDLQRPGTRTRFLVDTHAILLDHYLVLAKSSTMRGSTKSLKYERYDVSKLPIPMDLLMLESTKDDPVVKSSVRGVSSVAPPQAAAHANGASNGNSGNSLVPSTTLDNSKDDKILYPFRIKHLGKNGTYTLYASSVQNRQDWCEKIIEAKTKHAAALFAQNAEPFRLRVLADTAFAYSDHSAGSKSIIIKGTPVDRALKEVNRQYPRTEPRPVPVCRTTVHCATVFQQPAGRMKCAVGTDYGVYVSDYNDPRGWSRAIPILRVTQMAVFEEFNLLLLIGDKSLTAYHLDAVCPVSGVPSQASNDSARRAPQKLSGSREVGFFTAGRMKDRTLVIYKKRDGLSSTFKVLEPVLQKSASGKTRFFQLRRSQIDFFREYDEFYIPAESYGINMFHSSLAISNQRGIEILTLDKKQTWSVPDLRSETPEAQAYLTSIAHRIRDLRPLGMFRLSDSEFLVAYTECAVYVNKHGDVSRSVVMEFVGRAHSACLYGRFLILFNDDFVEVRNAMNGRLRQVIPGHNVICLDYGSSLPGSSAANNATPTSTTGAVNLASGLSGSVNGVSLADTGRTVKICMQHPEFPRSQIILELVENEGQKD